MAKGSKSQIQHNTKQSKGSLKPVFTHVHAYNYFTCIYTENFVGENFANFCHLPRKFYLVIFRIIGSAYIPKWQSVKVFSAKCYNYYFRRFAKIFVHTIFRDYGIPQYFQLQ